MHAQVFMPIPPFVRRLPAGKTAADSVFAAHELFATLVSRLGAGRQAAGDPSPCLDKSGEGCSRARPVQNMNVMFGWE